MKKHVSIKFLSCLTAVILIAGLLAGSVIPTSAVSDVPAVIRSAVQGYINTFIQRGEDPNNITKDGLLGFVNNRLANARLGAVDYPAPDVTFTTLPAGNCDDTFYVKHAVRGCRDEDTNSATKIDIPGSEGYVSALFLANGKKIGATAVIPEPETEILTFGKTITLTSNTISTTIADEINAGETGPYKLVFSHNGTNYTWRGSPLNAAGRNNIHAVVFNGSIGNDGISLCSGVTGLKAAVFNQDCSRLGSNAFADCTNLKYIKLSNNLTGLWGRSGAVRPFDHCSQLENMVIPENVIAFRFGSSTASSWSAAGTNIAGAAFFQHVLVRDLTFHPDVDLGAITSSKYTLESNNGFQNIWKTNDQMTFVRAAALAQAKINSYEGELTAEAVKAAVDAAGYGGLEITSSWNDTWGYIESAEYTGYAGTLTLSGGGAEIQIPFPVNFNQGLAQGLSDLSVDGYMIAPAFDIEILNYTVTVPNSVTSLTVVPVGSPKATNIVVTGDSGFAVGENTIEISVTVDGNPIIYTITVTRLGGNISQTDAVISALESFEYNDKTYQESLEEFLTGVLEGTGTDFEVTEFYIHKSIGGAKEGDKILVPGHDGYVTAAVTLKNGGVTNKIPVKGVIPAAMQNYSFSAGEVAGESDFKLSPDGKTLLWYSGDAKKVVIPEGVEIIDDLWMDGYAENVVVLVLPESLTTMPNSLCYGMRRLQAVYMGDRVTEIPANTFKDCFNLRYIRLSENLYTIGSYAFRLCASLSDMYIPESLREIKTNAFYYSLPRNFTFQGNAVNIGTYAFCWPNVRTDYFSSGSISSVVPADEVEALDAYIRPFAFDPPDDPNTTDPKELDKNRIPRVITFLDPNSAAENINAFSSDDTGAWGLIKVRAAAGTPIETMLKGKSNFEVLDMTLSESAARAQAKADAMPLSNETSAESVLASIQSAYISSKVSETVTWKEAFQLTPLTDDTQGHVTGVLEITGAAGVVFEIDIDRTFGASVEVPPYVPTQPEKKPEGNSVVNGHVYDENYNPVGGVTLRMYSEPVDAATNNNGRFEFTGVTAGYHELYVLRDNGEEVFAIELNVEEQKPYNIKIVRDSATGDILLAEFVTDSHGETPKTGYNDMAVAVALVILFPAAVISGFAIKRKKESR